MFVVAAKLIEALARAGFTVGAAFMLPLAAAGQFGMLVLMISLFAFAFGWERHIDLQRRMVGVSDHRFDRAVADALKLYGFNWLVMLPLFWVSVVLWAAADPILALFATIVVLAEQLGNQLYNITVVRDRYRPLLSVAAVKYLVLLVLWGLALLIVPDKLSVTFVMALWAAVSLVGTAAIGMMWIALHRGSAISDEPGERFGIFVQHRASFTHFLIGLVAVLVLQIDRLVVGSLMPFATVGIYFRHILLVSFAYQMFNIASYNRLVPRVFAAAKTQPVAVLRKIVDRELALVIAAAASGFALAFAIDEATGRWVSERFALNPVLGGVLVLGAMVRVAADLQALILNAMMVERRIFINQTISFTVGTAFLIAMTLLFGLYGTAWATVATSASYLLANHLSVRHICYGTA